MDNIQRDESWNVQWTSKRKKQISKRETIKKRKVSGEPHINHVGIAKNGVITGPDCQCKRLQCYSKITSEQQQQILRDFLMYSSKDEQDSHLAALISYKNIQQRRPRRLFPKDDEDYSFQHELAFSYKIRVNGQPSHEELQICAKAFVNLHGITRGRLRSIQSKIISGRIPKDLRGKHETRPKKVPTELLELIKLHIRSFKARQSHYSLRDNPNVMYLPEELSVNKMHQLFLNEVRINISYRIYYNVFNTHFNIKFGLPRSDTCSICDELNLRIKCATDSTVRAELIAHKTLHLSKAKKFRELKNAYKQKAQRGECMLLSFDYMQNLPLPHIHTSDVFYSHQMWYFVFGIHDLANDNASMYCYTEMTGKKGASDVTSLRLHYLNNREITSENLVLLSDGCGGQNKNHIMVYFQYFLIHVLKLFKTITHIFPIRGHSYLPNDADFALIGNKKKRCSPEIQIIREARKYPSPFAVVPVTQDEFFNMKEALSPYFLKTPKPALKLREARIIKTNVMYQHVKIKNSFTGPSYKCEIRKKQQLPTLLELDPLYFEPIQMTAAKNANLITLSKYLTCSENRDYYRQICCSSNGYGEEGGMEVDEEDNSDGCDG